MFVTEVDTIQTVRLEEKAKKKRQKTPVVGDMRLLADTLPTLDLLLKETVKTAPRDNTLVSSCQPSPSLVNFLPCKLHTYWVRSNRT